MGVVKDALKLIGATENSAMRGESVALLIMWYLMDVRNAYGERA